MTKNVFEITLICVLCGLLFVRVPAQNLVPNPSFENITGCPPGNSGISGGYCISWQRPPGGITTPDLFHPCGAAGTACNNINVPSNFGGVAPGRDGNAYAGVITWYNFCSDCREYVQAQLSTPLLPGTTYQIGFLALLSPFSRYGTDQLAIHLSNSPPSQPGNQPIAIPPTYTHPAQILDKTNWTVVSTSYVAAGGEQWVTVGSFATNAATNSFDFGPSGGSCALVTNGSTYYLDSVFVAEETVLDATIQLQAAAAGSGVLLNWAHDPGTVPLQLEHCTAGQTFSVLQTGSIAGKQSFLHADPFDGLNFYRLKVLDANGSAQYTNTVQLDFRPPDVFGFDMALYPNPASDICNLQLRLNAGAAREACFSVVTLLGEVAARDCALVPAGARNFSHSLNVGTLAAGTYFLRTTVSGMSKTKRLVLQ